MTDMTEVWMRQPVNADVLAKCVEYMIDRMAQGQESEEAISWAAIRYGVNVVRLRHELKERGLYRCLTP